MGGSGVAMALVPWLLWPRLRHVDTEVAVDEDRIVLLRSLPLFAPLSRFSLEHIARRAAAVAVDPGGVVVRQGEPGDLFYAVESGELSVQGWTASSAPGWRPVPASARSPCCTGSPDRHRGRDQPRPVARDRRADVHRRGHQQRRSRERRPLARRGADGADCADPVASGMTWTLDAVDPLEHNLSLLTALATG